MATTTEEVTPGRDRVEKTISDVKQLLLCATAATEAYNARLRSLEPAISPAEWVALTTLAEEGALPVGKLARKNRLPRSAIAKACRRLAKLGLVAPVGGDEGGSGSVALTDVGAEYIKGCDALLVEAPSALTDARPSANATSARRMMNALAKAINGKTKADTAEESV